MEDIIRDSRAEDLAKLVVNYSCEIDDKDTLLIQAQPNFRYYAELIAEEATKKGANILFDFEAYSPERIKYLLTHKNEWSGELARRNDLSLKCTSRCLIDCEEDPLFLKNFDSKLISEFESEVVGPYKKVLYREDKNGDCIVKWNIVGFPCGSAAEQMRMSLEDYANLVYNSTLIDWKRSKEEMDKVKSAFDNAKEVRLFVPQVHLSWKPEVDLRFSLQGRGGKICCGKKNMPDGEVCYGPVEDSMNGEIYFNYPAIKGGQEVGGIRLKFEKGKIINSDALFNNSFLDNILSIEGSRIVGEFGIGCNYGVKKYSKNLLFDEKIGGTIHLALGHGVSTNIKDGGSLNDSPLHWDLVRDLRRLRDSTPAGFNPDRIPRTQIYVDGMAVQENGKWKI